MSREVCVCRSCVDPRENGLYLQHHLPLYNGIYMARKKGAFIPKYNPASDFSTTMSMLLDLGKRPVIVLQGHKDCAAIRVLFDTFGRPENSLNDTEKELSHSHGDAVRAVKRYASVFSIENQLRILEKICVLQSINNFFEYYGIGNRDRGWRPAIFACFSESPPSPMDPATDPRKIGLMLFDPEQKVFALSAKEDSNEGCRIADLIDLKTFLPFEPQRFGLTSAVDLDEAVYNEVKCQLALETPRLKADAVCRDAYPVRCESDMAG